MEADDASGGPAELVASPAVLAGRYRLGDEIARGAGRVVMRRARDAVLERDVAVLTPCGEGPAERERFERDVTALAGLDHPALPRVFDGGVEDGRPYLVVELIRGETLAELGRRGQLGPAGVSELALTLTDVLEHVRRRGAGYVDVTPDAVLVEDDGRVRLSGVGVVRAPDGGEAPPARAVRELLGALTVTVPETAEHHVPAAPVTRPEGWAAAGVARLAHSRRRAVTVTVAAAALGAAFLLAPTLPTGGDADRGGSGAAAVIGPTPEPAAAPTRAAPTATVVPEAGRPAAEPRDRKGPAEPKGKDKGQDKGKAGSKGKKPKSP